MVTYKLVTDNKNTYFTANKITIGTAAPTSGTYAAGDIVLSSSANSTAFGWICTAAGTPGTWKVLKSGSDVTLSSLGAAASSHTHNYAGSSSVGGAANSANKVNTNLTIKLNGGTTEGTNLFTFNGSVAKTLDITPSSIGASASSHTHNYIPLSGSTAITGTLRTTSELQSTSANAFRAIYGDYGFIIRNDGSDTYFLLTNSEDQHGSWNSYRPFTINNGTGDVRIQSYTNFTNNIRMGVNNTYLYGTNSDGNAVPLLRLTSANVTDVGNTSGKTCLLGNADPVYYNGTTNYTLYHTGFKPSPADIGAAASSHGYHLPTSCDTVTNWDDATRTGFFMGHNATNSPEASKWYMGLVMAHNANYIIQIVYEFTAAGSDANSGLVNVWMRTKYNGTWGNWTSITPARGGSGNYWGKNVGVGWDGVVEVGKYIDFHLTHGATTDNDGRFTLNSAGNLHWSGNLSCAGNASINGTALTISSTAPSYGGVWIQI